MQSTERESGQSWSGWYHDAAVAAAALPALLVDAAAIAQSVAPGWHGRRRAGQGESFWQYRRFTEGDLRSRIDWRRSARDDHLYIREQEWEAAHTVWLWPDRAASMAFRSDLAPLSKERRAIVMALALGEILVRGGERIAIAGLTAPMTGQRAPRRLAEAIARMDPDEGPAEAGLPPDARLSAHADYVLFSDFLAPAERFEARLAAIAAAGARPHLVQILDPVEESFPFRGRIEFAAADGSLRYLASRAEELRDGYRTRLATHRARLRDCARRYRGSFIVHHTDRPPHAALLALHAVLTAPQGLAPPAGGEAVHAPDPPQLVVAGGGS